MSEATIDTATPKPEIVIIDLRRQPRPSLRLSPPVPGKTLNAFGRFVRGWAERSAQTVKQITDRTGIHESILSRTGYVENPADVTRAQARSYVGTIRQRYRRVRGFADFWHESKPDLEQWFKSLRRHPHHARGDADTYRAFLRYILTNKAGNPPSNIERAAAALRKIDALKEFDLEKPPKSKESAERRLYILAGIFTAKYLRRKKALDAYVQGLRSIQRASADSPIGKVTRHILSRSGVENGLVPIHFAEKYCGMAQPVFIQHFLQAPNPSQQRAVKVGLAFSQHASRNAWLGSAARFYELAAGLHPVKPRPLPTEALIRDPVEDLSLDALKQRIRDDWRGAVTEVIQRAVALKPDLESELTREWGETGQQIVTSDPKQPQPFTLEQGRAMLIAVERVFHGHWREPRLPVHLHNKPGRELTAREIPAQASWLLRLEIP